MQVDGNPKREGNCSTNIYSRMVWSDEKKGWELRRNKKRAPDIPPVIVATKDDAYEDVFRKREM